MDDLHSYIILFLISLVSIILVRFIIFTRNKTKGSVPPSPLALPIIGHLHLLAPLPHQALHKLSNRYGPLIHLFLGSVPCVVASSPEMAKEFLKTHKTSFSNQPQMAAKLCMSKLLGGQTLDQFLPVRREEITTFLQFILKKAEASEAVDVGGELMRVSNNIISRMTMSQRCSQNENEADKLTKLVKATAELTGKFNLSDYIWFCKNLDLQGFGKRLKEVRDGFDSMMERIIKEHEEERKKEAKMDGGHAIMKDLLHILLDISEDKSSEMRLTRENIKAFVLDIFAAGTDTSAITTEWALAELINHPNVIEKARQELDSVVGKKRLVEESDIMNLLYLQAIIKETLRLHLTGPVIVRELSEHYIIGDYEISPKTRLLVNVWAIGRDPKHWENPLEFRPDRFISKEGCGKNQLDVRGQHFHLLPFGSGRRGCPGTSLALQVVQTTLATLIQCFEWKVSGGEGIVDMEEGPGITLPRAHPLICVPVARLKPFPST
ncbi:cytochrome P450 93A3-like [Fagus crenata]